MKIMLSMDLEWSHGAHDGGVGCQARDKFDIVIRSKARAEIKTQLK